ncbi:hypothetical protein [Rossellomorea aquimaris]|jgi:hypothetical protein|uniref:Uncharacterized protein n=1 Tax=Rossellomorea aquimaris TaxID=189382 RepID=A0A5D4UL02_9BACI|nr:hypothetical protein [Rossellomorea aquimaris]TYS81314.1 hypothetical protein FZD05_00355 [Rossellomorea aquimaris]TYS87936.1 hypothetical protein FZC85_00360 [Rossellomorea aquimaris]
MIRVSRTKKVMLLVLAIILIIVANRISSVQHLTARIAANLYVSLKYQDLDLEYQNVEFSPQFGDYSVAYKDKDGKVYGFMVTPKSMPVIILHDPLNESP